MPTTFGTTALAARVPAGALVAAAVTESTTPAASARRSIRSFIDRRIARTAKARALPGPSPSEERAAYAAAGVGSTRGGAGTSCSSLGSQPSQFGRYQFQS